MMSKIIASNEQPAICPKFEFTFGILGKKWNGLIIEVLLEGESTLRFIDLSISIAGVSDRVLTERLKELESLGIIQRAGGPNNVRAGYCLTEKGEALHKVMNEVQEWADEWVCNEECQETK